MGEKKQIRNTSGLRNLADRSPEERRAIQSKGGKVSAARRKEARLVKDAMLAILTAPVHSTKGKGHKCKSSFELKSLDEALQGEVNTTVMVKVITPVIQKAMQGDTYCVQLILAILGQLNNGSGTDAVNSATVNNGVMIHLLRGEKPIADNVENLSDESESADV